MTLPFPGLAGPRWSRVIALGGASAGLAYGLLFRLPLPGPLQLFLAFLLAFGVIVTSHGLARLGGAHDSLLASLAMTLNIVAAGFMLALVLWQHAARGLGVTDAALVTALGRTLAMGWDLNLAAATVLLALAVGGHRRFGRPYAWSGVVVGLALFLLSLLRFPRTTAEAGFPDLTIPLAGWYALLLLRVWWLGERHSVAAVALTGSAD